MVNGWCGKKHRQRHGHHEHKRGDGHENTGNFSIYDELCLGKVRDTSHAGYRRIMQKLVDRGAQGMILGCTELSLLVGAGDVPVPVFDTVSIHARSAVERALQEPA